MCLFITIGVCDPWNSPKCKKQNAWVDCEIDELKCNSTNEEGELIYFLNSFENRIFFLNPLESALYRKGRTFCTSPQ